MDDNKFQDAVLQELKTLVQGQQRLASRFDDLDVRLLTVEKGQLRLETRMENEVIDKIRMLFDANEVQNDRYERVGDQLDDILTDVRYLVARVAKLEKIAK